MSPDTPDENVQFRQENGLPFALLSDVDMSVTDKYGLRHPGGRAATGEDKPYPTTFIIDGQGRVLARLENETHRQRPQPETVLQALRDAVAPETWGSRNQQPRD